jgi:hypothetical protein
MSTSGVPDLMEQRPQAALRSSLVSCGHMVWFYPTLPAIFRGLRMVANALDQARNKVGMNQAPRQIVILIIVAGSELESPPSHVTAKSLHVRQYSLNRCQAFLAPSLEHQKLIMRPKKLSISMADGTADVHKHLERSGGPDYMCKRAKQFRKSWKSAHSGRKSHTFNQKTRERG